MSRMFHNFAEAQNEIMRDLAELSVVVQPETMQDKFVGDDPDFETRELSNYTYTVLDADYRQVDGVHSDWLQQEWEDRLVGDLNPGQAWKTRKEVWEEFLEGRQYGGRFSYTYSERMGGAHIQRVIDELAEHPHSRQLWLPVWWPVDETRRGERRVPCSLGYHFLNRSGELHVTYMMRSCDFITHYANDVALACALNEYIADKAGLKRGTFTHFVGSLHVYAKDVEGVF